MTNILARYIGNLQIFIVLGICVQSLHAFPTNYRTTTSIVNDLFNIDFQRPHLNTVDQGSPFQNPLDTVEFVNTWNPRRIFYPPTVVTPYYQRPVFVNTASTDNESDEEARVVQLDTNNTQKGNRKQQLNGVDDVKMDADNVLNDFLYRLLRERGHRYYKNDSVSL
jgi:hypothetical protein